jgi:16S rRNA processing protein RimM
MTHRTSPWIVLAHLLRPQGRKGELLAELFTDFPDRFEARSQVYLAAPGFEGTKAEARSVEVVAFWLPVGKNEGRIVLQFAGVDTIVAAEALAGQDVMVPGEERVALGDDSVYISELIGCTVYDGSVAVGVVDDVQFAMTADGRRRLEDATPMLTLTSVVGDEILIPFAKAFLKAVNTESKRIEMMLPEGLIELNRTADREENQK